VRKSQLKNYRQREGIAIAKREGEVQLQKTVIDTRTGGRVAAASCRWRLEGCEFGISRDTLYRYVPVKKRRAGKLAK